MATPYKKLEPEQLLSQAGYGKYGRTEDGKYYIFSSSGAMREITGDISSLINAGIKFEDTTREQLTSHWGGTMSISGGAITAQGILGSIQNQEAANYQQYLALTQKEQPSTIQPTPEEKAGMLNIAGPGQPPKWVSGGGTGMGIPQVTQPIQPVQQPIQGKELPFPTTQAQMAEYQAKHTFTGGKWYEGKGTTPATPIIPETGTTGPVTSDEERARAIAAKEKEIKDVQDALAKAQTDLLAAQTEEAKLAAQKNIQDLKTALGLTEAKPVTPTYASDYEALRSEKGIEALETQINSLSKEMRDLETSYKAGLEQQEERLAPMEIIGTKQAKLQRKYQLDLEFLSNRKSDLIDEYNTKISVVNNIMQFKQLDYNAAVNDYNTNFTQAIQLQTLLMNIEDKANAEANAQRDDARANLTLILNNLKDTTYTDMPADLQATTRKLETQAGYPSGMIEYLTSIKTNVLNDIVAHGTVTDADGNQFVYMIERDAETGAYITKNISTGGVKTEPEKEFSFNNDQKGQLLGLGFTNDLISIFEDNLNYAGLDKALDSITGTTDEEKKDIKNIVTKKEDVIITKDWLTKTFGEEEITRIAREKGYAKWYLPKAYEKNAYLNDLVKKIAEEQQKGIDYKQVLREEGFSL